MRDKRAIARARGWCATWLLVGLALEGVAHGQVTLNGVSFDGASARLTHPYFPMSVGDIVAFDGFGRKLGCVATLTAEGPEVILGISTVRIRLEERCPGQPPGADLFWLAQDTQGNIHEFQTLEMDEPLRTVTATQLPNVFLPAAPTAGQTFPDRLCPCLSQKKIVTLTASRGGLDNLLQRRTIDDKNGDGRLDETPGGPDEVNDVFFAPGIGVVREEEVERGQLGGFIRRGVGPKPSLLAPATGASFGLAARPSVSFRWSSVTGADLYALEYTGANRTFANPNGAGPDSVNGFGGTGSAILLPGDTSLTLGINPQAPAGAYEWRIVGLRSDLIPVGVFSDAFTIQLTP